MTIKLSDKSAQQLSNILYLLGNTNASHAVAQMITIFELDLAKSKTK